MPSSFFTDMLSTLTDRSRALLGLPRGPVAGGDLPRFADQLLSRRGEASGVVLARTILDGYRAAPPAARLAFLKALAERFGPDPARLEAAIAAWRETGDADAASDLALAAEARRQELFRRLNLAPGGTAALVRMRADLLTLLPDHPELGCVDRDFTHLFSSWFNRGFLVLRHIDWTTPANILEKIIRYEAVHEIRDWNDLRNRLEPTDRRCFAFFHPQLVDEPLIFVEVALTTEIPGAIGPLLDLERKPIPASEATTAVFYSISNTQQGLAGVSFGNFLIKQVVEDLKRELPNLKTFVTLSPVPGFAGWVKAQRAAPETSLLDDAVLGGLAVLDDPGFVADPERAEAARRAMLPAAAAYFLRARTPKGRPVDPVARFHLGNGARLERLNPLGDLSAKGLRQSFGLMVNYCYDLDDIEENHEAFAEKGTVAASRAVQKALKPDRAEPAPPALPSPA
ncbi:malonyl-CoA decarboxylase [Alsobacter sp. R-9]